MDEIEKRLRPALDAADITIWDWDILTDEIKWFGSLETRLGSAPGSFSGSYKDFLALVHLEDREHIRRSALRSVSEGKEYYTEFRFVGQDGSIRWISSKGQIIFDDSGRPVHMVGVDRDITERKKAEELIRNTALFPEENPFPVLRVAGDGTLLYANRAAAALLSEWQSRVGTQVPEFVKCALKTALDCGERQELETLCGARELLFDLVPIAGQSYVNLYGRDVTERNQAKKALRNAEYELEHRVQMRTADLVKAKGNLEVVNEELRSQVEEHEKLEKRLAEAKEAAEAIVQARAQLLANISHELRTPMNTVIGMTSILLEENLTSEQREFVETIREGSESMLSVVNRILDLSMKERRKTALKEQPFDLRTCIEGALDLIALKAEEYGLNLAYMMEWGTVESAVGDPTKLLQVLVNLLDNAVRFTEEGEVVVTVSSKPDNNDIEVHFAVQDTGIGISQDMIGRLFSAFDQANASTNHNHDGTGLGLPISKKLVEMMRGKIWVESKSGRGSTFHFTIRVKPAPDRQSDLNVVQPHLADKRILIVDENRTNRRILGLQAYVWGMTPLVAVSGDEALNWVRHNEPLDVAVIGGPDAPMLAKEIRRYRKNLPLVAMSSQSQKMDGELFTASLTKPIKPYQLFDTITAIFTNIPAEAVQTSESARRPLRILLAEDNAMNQKVILLMLKKLGYSSDVAANGLEVLSALKRQPYDVVLMDIHMPEMNGIDATQAIRSSLPEPEQPKIIAITAYALEGDRERCISVGMNDYIAKPVNMYELKTALERFNRRSADTEA